MKKQKMNNAIISDYEGFIREIPDLLKRLTATSRIEMNFTLENIGKMEEYYRSIASGKRDLPGEMAVEEFETMIKAFIGEAVIRNAAGQWVLNNAPGDSTYGTAVISYICDNFPRVSPREQMNRVNDEPPGVWVDLVSYCKEQVEEEA